MIKRLLLFLTLVFTLFGCSADLNEYSGQHPKFNLFEYFEGETHAWGMVQDYTDKQTRRFSVILRGKIEGDVLTLDEDFIFADGEKSKRIWVITRQPDGTYSGKADDIIGAAKGREVGNALQWQYDFELELDGSSVTVAFDDWLYRQDEKRVFNLTKIKKFGIEVGTITLFFEKQ
ncbi:DUF3833 domain-containing protein [Vibrio hannami]|uniref:DUF3833 domain-containing protein n=1 Tax=Vibrio hannami TaxID=2717094 RepID=UPI003EBB28FC